MKFSLLSRLVRSLAAVDGPALHRGLAEFLRSRHDVEEEEISEPAQARVSALHARLRITDDEPTVGPESCGFYLRYEGEGRHGERLWLGVRPPVARRLGVADETMLLLLGGHLPGKEHGILETWRQTYGLRCTSVHSGQELPESAIPITEESAEKALDDLIRALKIPRARGRK